MCAEIAESDALLTSVIETGGTFSMGRNDVGLLVPCYDLRHFALAAEIARSTTLDAEEKANRYQELIALKSLLSERMSPSFALNAMAKSFLGNEPPSVTAHALLLASQNYDTLAHTRRPYGPGPFEYIEDDSAKARGLIDSIDFDLETHYPKLQQAVMEGLVQQRNLLVIGGTDTLEFYAAALARDPAYCAWRANHPELTTNVLFLSSMQSFEDNPEHIGKLFAAATRLLWKVQPGIYALSASDVAVQQLTLHDVQHPFMKISGQLPDALRSATPYSKMEWREIEASPCEPDTEYQPHAPEPTASIAKPPIPTAAPLIAGNRPDIIAAYLRQLAGHSVVVEVSHALLEAHEEAIAALLSAVRERTAQGIPTIFVNDHAYAGSNEHDGAVTPTIPPAQWAAGFEEGVLKQLGEAGATLLAETTTAAAFLDSFFNRFTIEASVRDDAVESLRIHPATPVTAAAHPTHIGLRYVPHHSAFRAGLEAAGEILTRETGQSALPSDHQNGVQNPSLIIQALPGSALPERHVPDVKAILEKAESHGRPVSIKLGFKYAGNDYATGKEGSHEPDYAAAKAFQEMAKETDGAVRFLGTQTPQQLLAALSTGGRSVSGISPSCYSQSR